MNQGKRLATICLLGICILPSASAAAPARTTQPAIPPAIRGTIKSTEAGGKFQEAATWIGGKVPGDLDAILIQGPVIIDADLGTAHGGGVGNIIIDGPKAALTSDGQKHQILFASTGNDPVDAPGGGKIGNPGPHPTMFGILQKRGTLNLQNITFTTPDAQSPIYIRSQVLGNSPADITLQNCTINNLGTPVSSPNYTGIVLSGQAKGFKVDVQGCTFQKYFRLLVGEGADASLLWKDNRSYHAGDSKFGAVSLMGAGFTKSTLISGNVDDLPDAIGMYIYAGAIGNAVVVERNAVRGSKAFRRGLYTGGGRAGEGNATFRNNLAVNYPGSAGTASMIYLSTRNKTTDLHTIIEGNVGTGCYETIALRPVMGNAPADRDTTTPTQVLNNWLSEDYDMAADQGVIMIGGTAPTVCNNIIRVANSQPKFSSSMGFFAYDFTTNLIFDRNTVIGVHNAKSGPNSGVTFGEGGFPIYKVKARSNLVVNWDWGISDMNHNPSQSTYDPDADVGVGVHHNATFGCTKSYLNDEGVGFKNAANVPHPDLKAYGDLDNVDPQFADPTRTPFTYDKKLGGDGTCDFLFTKLAQHKLGENPIEDLRKWLFEGYAPTNSKLRGAGYKGEDIGAVPIVSKRAAAQ